MGIIRNVLREESIETEKPTEESTETTSITEPATTLLTQSSTKIITVPTTTVTNPTTTPVSGPITTISATTAPVSNASNATATTIFNNSTNFYKSKSSSGLSTGAICAIAIPCAAAVMGAVSAALLLKGGATPIPQMMAPSLPPSNFIDTSIAKMNIVPKVSPQQPLPVEIIQPQPDPVQMIQPQPVQRIIFLVILSRKENLQLLIEISSQYILNIN